MSSRKNKERWGTKQKHTRGSGTSHLHRRYQDQATSVVQARDGRILRVQHEGTTYRGANLISYVIINPDYIGFKKLL